ncbi:peptidase S8/S53 domain-containing protein [Gongronella butleri]|nr:peptidase S8/S53 domain-containing protein [Gongronella butleri]
MATLYLLFIAIFIFHHVALGTGIENYILVFKQDAPALSIHQHLRQMYQHVHQHANVSMSVKMDELRTSTIGGFQWYTGAFPSLSFETLYADLQHSTIGPTIDHNIVQYWVKDTVFEIQEMIQENPPSWGLDRIDQRSGTDGLYKFPDNQGEGTTVYILDTGVDETNADLEGRVTIGETVVGNDPSDNDGHGTFVAGVCCGTTYGVAKLANIVSVKTLNSDGTGRLSDLLLGLEWVAEQHMNTSNDGSSSTDTASSSSSSVSAPIAAVVNTTTTTTPHVNATVTHPTPTHHTLVKKHASTTHTTAKHTSAKPKHTSAKPSHMRQASLPANSSTTAAPSTSASANTNVVKQPTTKSIINLSLGALYSQACNDAVEQILRLGIHVTVAAGNYGEDACLYSPGSTSGAVTVGAIDKDDSVAYYSNFGTCVDIFAPGSDIKSIVPYGDSTTTKSGTSMAAPHVAGAMALYLADSDYTPAQLLTHLQTTSSLMTLDFSINNTDNNPNKSVLDNGVSMGVPVAATYQQQFNTSLNVLYTSPNDGQATWIYGNQIPNHAALSSQTSLLVYPVLLLCCLYAAF